MSTSNESSQTESTKHHLPTNYTPFILLTPRLLLAPTPSLLPLAEYRHLYASLHAIKEFCEMGFGPDWGPRNWDEKEAYEIIEMEVKRNWEARSMGDFGVAEWGGKREKVGRVLRGAEEWEEIRLVEGEELERLIEAGLWEQVDWVGYAGVREARLPALEQGEELRPSWLECESSAPPFEHRTEATSSLCFPSHRASIRPRSSSLGQRNSTRVCESCA